MTAQHGLERGLREFLREQESRPAYLPEVLAATSRTRQRGPSLAQRLIGEMPPLDRRMVRVAAIGLMLAALVGVALVVGSMVQRNDDPDAFVLAAYEQVATELPPMRLVIRESMEGVLDLVLFYDGDRTIREEYGDATTVFGSDFVALRQPDVPGQPWVVTEQALVPGIEQVERVLHAVGFGGPTNCATGWESLGTEVLIGRSTRHVRCVAEPATGATTENHLWIDLQTGLPLRMASPFNSGLTYVYVAELEIGPQPASLFQLDGETIPTVDPPWDYTGPAPCRAQPAAGPLVTPPPAPAPAVAPADLDAFVAQAHAAYEGLEAVEIVSTSSGAAAPTPWTIDRWLRDGRGNYRTQHGCDPGDGFQWSGWLASGGRLFESAHRDGKPWREWPRHKGPVFPPTFGLPTGCGIGWRYLGDDLVLGRAAAHLVCGHQEFWIDREWMLVTRAHDHDPLLGDDAAAGVSEVVSVTFGPQPAELFAVPSPDEVWR